MSMISIRDVSYAYKQNQEIQWAVRDVNLEIAQGEIVSFIGPSGCGKSTVLNMLAGLLVPTQGNIYCNDHLVQGPSLERGVVFQSYSLFPWMTAEENILLALQQVRRQESPQELKKVAHRLLDTVGLQGADQKYPAQLSGGMQQRVALARLFAVNSPVFLMDEPFGAVDAAVRATLQDCLIQLWSGEEAKKTVILVTHDIDEAILLSDRIVVFSPGPGKVEEVISVDIPRPRKRSQLFMSPRYVELRAHLLSSLHNDSEQEGKVVLA
ncbi:ABC transporter ATP-binding protein [Ammoniphilus sp. CFH 90114]|uniref:ABC transporter ATP-binding protein n=1 Tax=Ammoniphilus sp. CFH 90114 TaxID=2493665 RepID=UPI00100DF2A0|nr:ABC transporter ATP-binding protein [Ammoniphilus sp. CFH 90114]RXT08000.1 ABC transporter ATP-binding protein [Ammoniphilus sp. CFH 90114]